MESGLIIHLGEQRDLAILPGEVAWRGYAWQGDLDLDDKRRPKVYFRGSPGPIWTRRQ